jgi:hypothetical protein
VPRNVRRAGRTSFSDLSTQLTATEAREFACDTDTYSARFPLRQDDVYDRVEIVAGVPRDSWRAAYYILERDR